MPQVSPMFDFDGWSRLAQGNPEAFFAERRRVIERFIDSHPHQREQLLALQGRIDVLRVVAGSPENAARVLCAQMGERLQALAGHLRALRRESAFIGQLPQGN
ncbi:MAG: DUF3135 domain-containing protein [Betaproteobacteria bacterium]|nr:DUF3135 domain-containing protein [Betaproteobacteria bacterium]